jgi:rhamnose transport system permease protein
MRRVLSRRYLRELVVVILLPLTFLVNARLSPYFLDPAYLLSDTSQYMEAGIAALALTFIIISGHIDLSVASNMALVACATASLHARLGVPMEAAIPIGLLLGGLLGLFNGLLIAGFRLPSLTVTLGTFALYRGIAQILLGDQSISRFPEWFVGMDYRMIGPVPLPLLIFLTLAILFALILHRTLAGRWIYALGANPTASRLSGIPVRRATIALFAFSGFCAGLAGLMMASRLNVARYDMATGLELDAITAVVLGGTDIFGGRGTIFGTVLALFLIGILRSGMGLANIKIEQQLVAIGALLIVSIALPNLLQRRRS